MNEKTVNYLLINTPLTDPTTPYHSIPYLVGAASQAGFTNYSCLDANIEALNYLAQEEQVADLLKYCENVRINLESKVRLTRSEQLLYRTALKAFGMKPDSVLRAVQIMKNPEDFYNYEVYRQAVWVLERWIDILSVQGFPGQFDGFYLDNQYPANLSSVSDLTNDAVIDRLINPFFPYFSGPFTQSIKERDWNFVGLSVNYIFQLPFAIWMCKYIRSLLPDTIISVGGTEISDLVKYLRDPNLIWDLLPYCDVVMVGEGETALIEILQSISQQQGLPKQRPGILLRDEVVTRSRLALRYEDVSSLPEPKYDVWNWQQYWSPEPVVLYSPTRGCYWNRCTFCDYGLNTDSPTSPSRERPVETVVREIANISRFARTFYFAVDAMSPLYLRKLAEALVENGIAIRWSAELRLERSLKKELAHLLKKAGCVCISFGYESGSQRILDLINKGVKVQEIPQILRQLSEVDIGAQMMGFTGFPGESLEEAVETFQFLKENRAYWTLAGIGNFVLTPGAIVAKRPQEFGIKEVTSYFQDDIIRSLCWVDEEGEQTIDRDIMLAEQTLQVSDSLNFINGHRPFVGGIDSSHSILYFAKFGKGLVPSTTVKPEQSKVLVETVCYENPHQKIDKFVRRSDFDKYFQQKYSHKQSPCFDDISKWLEEYPEEQEMAHKSNVKILAIHPTGEFIQRSPVYHAVRELCQREGILT
ncbi:B12-binding domain-containing radical SAM protein [Nostoc sp. CHAB 5784]|uniref:B12-binding domain-containing radical SAM protein n=1 Tax=Nostoc mirabile TaxID=2907820 RepID=UPI001E64C6D7|nr:radical SAM protein [Nostoc mirabile]MCC5668494.1 B12-binding domain-containing radical SAM protein [Nostoc mirabile CHAB5784]